MIPEIKAKALRVSMARALKDAPEVAKETGLNVRTVKRLAEDGGRVKLSTVGKLAQALGVDVTEIAEF